MTTVAWRPQRAVARLALRQIRLGAVIVAAVCAVMSAVVALQYRETFQGALDQGSLRALVENPAIRVLFGPAVALDDPGGFTVWRTGTPLMVLASVWVLLAATRITRGEEDAGRWQLLLSGPVRPIDAAARCLAVLTGAALLISVAVAGAMLAADTQLSGSVVYATGMFGVVAAFAALGLLTAQVATNRATAVGLAVAGLMAALLLRMVADGVAPLSWLAWLSPFGLVARAAPYADNDPVPLAVLIATATLTAVVALAAARRDLDSGWLRVRTRRRPHTALLGSIAAFAVRRAIRPLAGWGLGIGVYFAVIGAMTASVLAFFDDNPRFGQLASTAGFVGLDSAGGFAAALFNILPLATGLYAAARLATFVAEERARRWTLLLATDVSRMTLIRNEITAALLGVLVLHAIAALAMWIGAEVTGAPLTAVDALAGALNTAPIAGLALGAAALAAGWAPAMVGLWGAVPVVGGFLVGVVSQSTGAPQWVTNVSPFTHATAVPLDSPHLTALGVMIALGAAAAALGVAGFNRRDLVT
ncbi:polyketide antibiotic transporter [Mycolicibacterium duvalii]|uniref:Exporter of polyketide antibiotics n=1 Tax=Mycolicibacterium duvalii TaxID=39688 RepID=A0A7I7JZC6_9MYCO|nr:polyketide antibiotic transporter [Mycolicibacterium duvalii]MCV7369753.1 polyketide antibiotic transporter [Mycolicibacterium duvalii]PEG43463.1 polyketide antibiotic transporter [Mycolicibacterium duvalii]BBX17237.1 exporter of polyketide antibiotics [Mycolicibacterium duvalii]